MIDIKEFERHTSFKPSRKISIEEKKEWERIFSSLRSGAILTGTVMGNDTVMMPDGEEKLALTIIQYRIKVIIPYDEVWYDSKKMPAAACYTVYDGRACGLCYNGNKNGR